MSQTPSHILENLQTALPAVAKAIKGGWDNIQSFAIKTNSSVSLPIWSCTLDETEGGRWNGLRAEEIPPSLPPPPPPVENAIKPSISKQEMRQKRSGNTSEKKKKIMITSKGGRSVKNAVLGKKVGQE
jgi:ribosome biogenesis protein UTP30